jgi:hypothetical protein
MRDDISDGNLGVMNSTDPIGFKVRQIWQRVPAELEHLYVMLQIYNMKRLMLQC